MRRVPLNALEPATLAALHLGVLKGDQQAREDVCDYLLHHVCRILRRRVPFADPALINDAVEDAALAYLANPENYDPDRSRLETFITVAASRRALNALRSCKRRQAAEQRSRFSLPRTTDELPSESGPINGSSRLRQVVANRLERRFLLARLAGMRRTADLAEVLEISHLPLAEQRRNVKRVTERLRARLRRLSRIRS